MPFYLWRATHDLDKSAAVEQRLRKVLPDLAAISTMAEALPGPAKKTAEEIYLLALAPSGASQVFADVIDIASRPRDRPFIILISDEISIGDYKALVRTGGADWVSSNSSPQEVLDIILRRQARTAIEPKPASEGKPIAISFVASAGGVGNTTLAVETGVHLRVSKATRHRNICLVDLDFQSSNVCDYLDIEPRLQIQEISANPERLDAQLFDIFVSRHASGLDVFAAPRSKFDYCDLDVSALDTLFSIASTRYDMILIDVPVTWLAWTPKIIEASDAVLVTGVNTVPGLRQTVETLAAVRQIPRAPGQIAVAINRCRRRLLGGVVRRHHVETALGRERVIYVGEEPMALESINTGSPMAVNASYRAVGKDIAALAAFCVNVTSVRAEDRREAVTDRARDSRA
jgi:pilus assembly protein CpaE